MMKKREIGFVVAFSLGFYSQLFLAYCLYGGICKMLEELTTEWIEYINEGYGFWAKIRKTKRILYRSIPCNNVSRGSSGDLAGGRKK